MTDDLPGALPGPPLRRRLVTGLGAGLYWTGIAAGYARLRPLHGALILMYHSVPDAGTAAFVDPRNAVPARVFERQMGFLARRRKVISLASLAERLARGEGPAPGSVVITFDDGYRDNLQVAAPILDRLGLPATLYLATGYVERQEPQWIDQLFTIFRTRTRRVPAPPGAGDGAAKTAGRATATSYLGWAEHLRIADAATRRSTLADLSRELQPRERAPALSLSWSEVRELRDRYPSFTLGAHTREHLDLTTLRPDHARAEIQHSLDDLLREVELETSHFSFPYGRSSAVLRTTVEALDLTTAVVTGPAGPIEAGADRLALPRFEATRDTTRIRFCTGGAWPRLPMSLVGRA